MSTGQLLCLQPQQQALVAAAAGRTDCSPQPLPCRALRRRRSARSGPAARPGNGPSSWPRSGAAACGAAAGPGADRGAGWRRRASNRVGGEGTAAASSGLPAAAVPAGAAAGGRQPGAAALGMLWSQGAVAVLFCFWGGCRTAALGFECLV